MSDELRAELEKAFDAVEDTAEVEEVPQEPIEEEAEAPKEVQTAEEAAAEPADKPLDKPEDTPVETASKPPAGWSPTQKEKWSEIPADLQKTILERDNEVDRVLHETAEDRKTAQSYKQMVDSYAPVFAAEGVQDPMQGIQGLINITAQLQMGSPQQKAERIAGLISHYGIDIQALDSVLAGETVVSPEMNQMQQYMQQQMAPVNQLLERVNAAEQQGQQKTFDEAGQSIEAFAADPQNEFFENVRMAMADFMDIAEKNQTQMSLQEAYDRACAMNPEIAQVQASRRTAENQQAAAQKLQGKQAAASSITGQQSGIANDGSGMSLRETLEAQFDKTGM